LNRKRQFSEEPGIFQDVDALAGTEVFNVYGLDGNRLGRWESAEGVTDDILIDAFGALVDRNDTPQLRIIPASRGASS
jgi:hypothetical protein